MPIVHGLRRVPRVTAGSSRQARRDREGRCDNLSYGRAYFFFFQAEDGIRDVAVTGVQTCALPIFSERTARLSTPYEGRPNDYGILVMTEEELYAHGRKAHLAGWQVGTHANGDVAIDTTLRVYERLQRRSEEHTSELQSRLHLVCRL